MNRIWRNRILLVVGFFVVALALIVIQHYGIYDFKEWVVRKPTMDPIAVIEENGHVDILYYGIGEYESNLLGKTPAVALGIIYYAPSFKETDGKYHVYLTNKGWKILRGEYDWNPNMEEEYQDQYLWNFKKFHWWKERALFKPGQYDRVHEALHGLLDWHQEKVFRDFFYRVFVWAENSGVEWRAIEIDFVELNGPAVLPGYTMETGIGYVTGFWPSLKGTLVMFKTRKETIFILDGRWVTVIRNPVQEALEAGELTEALFNEMTESRQLQPVDVRTNYGPRQYGKGFNHPWQGRELSEPGAT